MEDLTTNKFCKCLDSEDVKIAISKLNSAEILAAQLMKQLAQ